MSYTTDFTGEIRINPPIPWAEIKNSPFTERTDHYTWYPDSKDVKFEIEEIFTETDQGTLITRSAVAVISAEQEEPRGRDTTKHLQELIDAHGDGRTFTGHLDAAGERAGDLWRLQVRNGRAVVVKPRIVWPDDDEDPRPR